MKKKADVNWVIIGMVLALMVLFVVGYIFYKQTKSAQTGYEGLSSCESRGGTCETKAGCDSKNGEAFWHYGCPEKDKPGSDYCCVTEQQQTATPAAPASK
jgi:hypothetical protein